MQYMKKCSKCGEVKNSSEFSKQSDKPSGLRSHCKVCTRNWNLKYYKKIYSRTNIESPKKKRCSLCKEVKNSSEFPKNKGLLSGLSSWCRPCESIKTKERYDRLRGRAVIETPIQKRCPKCKKIRKCNDFYKDKTSVDGLDTRCKECKAKDFLIHYKNDPDWARNKGYLARYKITLSEVKNRLNSQGGACAICGVNIEGEDDFGRLAIRVDHDHKTSLVRGLLCVNCNRGLGCFFDNPDFLLAAINYITKSNYTLACRR